VKRRKPKIISIANQKGGVGKSTTAVNMCTGIASLGSSVLVIDIDPQGNATSGLGLNKAGLERCIYDVILGSTPLDETVHATASKGLDIIPATLRLAGAEIELVSALSRETRLEKALQTAKHSYDYVFIDCPPSLGLLTVNALTASHSVIIPIQCEYYALEGLTQLMNVVSLVQKHLNPSLEVEGVLLTMYDGRLNLSQQVAQEVRDYFKEKVYRTVIPRNVRISEAPSFGKPVLLYDGKSKGARAYLELAKEVVRRAEEGHRHRSGAKEVIHHG
jgi:chromosome partitioning protein